MDKKTNILYHFFKLITPINATFLYEEREFLTSNLYMWCVGLRAIKYLFFKNRFFFRKQVTDINKHVGLPYDQTSSTYSNFIDDTEKHKIDSLDFPSTSSCDDNALITKKKKRPNYFVAIQITDEKIHDSVKQVQDHILKQDQSLLKCLIPRKTLHITLMVMYLQDLQDYNNAMKALTAVHQEYNKIICKEPLKLQFSGMGHFGNRVLYAKIKQDSSYKILCDLTKSVHKHTAAFGIVTTDSRKEFNPHLTIAKLDYTKKSLRRIKKLSASLYEEYVEFPFGYNTIKSIQLLKMAGPKNTSGYYFGDELFFSPSEQMQWKKLNTLLAVTEKKKEIRSKISKLTSNIFK